MRLVVIGGYGYTGKLICEELDNESITFAVAGRNEEKLNALKFENNSISQVLQGDILNLDFVQKLMDEFDYFINCAGPFTEESNILLEAVAKKGKAYFDITGEIGFVRESRENWHNQAIKSGALLLHGCAFESLIVDLTIQKIVKGESKIKGVRTFYWFNQKRVSPGTKITMKLAQFRKLYKIVDNEWKEGDLTKDRLKIHWYETPNDLLGIPYPLPEIAYMKWRFNPSFAESYLLLPENEAMFMGQSKAKKGSAGESLERLKTLKQPGPSSEERATQKSKVIVEVQFESKPTEYTIIENTDMYGTTAKSTVLALISVQKNRSELSGVIPPADVFKSNSKETLEKLNCQFLESKSIKISAC